jgi:hypothetical protein
MRRSYLALIALTFGLLTLACSGGGSSLVGPSAVTDSGAGQVSLYATGAGPLVQVDVTPTSQDSVPARPINSSRGDIEPID